MVREVMRQPCKDLGGKKTQENSPKSPRNEFGVTKRQQKVSLKHMHDEKENSRI